jgi:hypothetical protein
MPTSKNVKVNWHRAIGGYLIAGAAGGVVGALSGKDLAKYNNVNTCLDCGTTWNAQDLYRSLNTYKRITGKTLDLTIEEERTKLNVFLVELQNLIKNTPEKYNALQEFNFFGGFLDLTVEQDKKTLELFYKDFFKLQSEINQQHAKINKQQGDTSLFNLGCLAYILLSTFGYISYLNQQWFYLLLAIILIIACIYFEWHFEKRFTQTLSKIQKQQEYLRQYRKTEFDKIKQKYIP